MKSEEKENGKRSIDQKRNRKAIKVGLFGLSALIVFYLGANFLMGNQVFGYNKTLYAIFDNAKGLPTGTGVFVNGFKIGKVVKIELTDEVPARVKAKLMIYEKIEIPSDSRFELGAKDILGGLVINLKLGTSTKMAEDEDNMTAVLIPAVTDGLDGIKDQLGSIMSSIDTVALELKDILHSDNGPSSLKNIFTNLESTTAELNLLLNQNRSKFGKIVTNLDEFALTLKTEAPKLKEIIDNFDKISSDIAKEDLAQVILNANQTITELQQVIDKINKGEGDLGKLVNDKELYKNLANSTDNLNKLLIDIKENPERYIQVSVFGKKKK
jgi:phospholipid/cholesterol/gamma-HCH transport system substrate-binding protein